MSSEKNILKSTGIIGGAQVIVMIFGLLKSKVVAYFLGPAGIGLLGVFQSAVNVVQGAAGLGIDNSAVRDIAQANSKDDQIELAKTVQTQRTLVLITGSIGLLLTLFLAQFISDLTFDSPDYSWEIRLLSLSVFFTIVKGGQSALLQGLRRIKDLAMLSIFGAIFSAIISIPVVYYFKIDGVSIFLVLISFGQLAVSWWYSRKVKLEKLHISWIETWERSHGMIRLGLAFMGGSLVTLISAYLIKVLIIQKLDVESAGIYQAAYVISGLYINTILQAMGKDFYPRLTSVSFQPKEEIQLINEQTELGLILSAPGLLFTLGLSPWVIEFLYSDEFVNAVPILQWIILGVFIRTASWPIGYMFIARAQSKLFFAIQVIMNGAHLILAYFLLGTFGLIGLGIAFCCLYIFHISLLFFLAYRVVSFTWNKNVIKQVSLSAVTFIISMLIVTFADSIGARIIVVLFALYFTWRAYNRIKQIMGEDLLNILWIKLTRLKSRI